VAEGDGHVDEVGPLLARAPDRVAEAPGHRWTKLVVMVAEEEPRPLPKGVASRSCCAFDRVAQGAGTRVVRTAVQAPLMNSVCERFLGSVRRECLLSETHLRYVLVEYALIYFNTARPHQGIAQRIPVPGERVRTRFAGSVITALPVLGGLHHDYHAAA
jgi:hypothetical protein